MSITYLQHSTVSKLTQMVARSRAFQLELEKYTEDEAATRIHRWLAVDPDKLPRPFAIISVDDSSAERISGGGKDSFQLEETLKLWISTTRDETIPAEMTLDWFWEWAKEVRDDVLNLSSVDDYLSISRLLLDGPPTISGEEGGEEVPHVSVIWQIELGGYTKL